RDAAGGAERRGAAGPAAAADSPSTYWALSQQVAAQLNQVVGGPLAIVDAITANPPSASDGQHAVWAPPAGLRSPVDRRLVVARIDAAHHAFQLQVKPRAAGEEAWQPFLAGASVDDGLGRRTGALSVDFTLLHGLDPQGQPDGGRVQA